MFAWKKYRDPIALLTLLLVVMFPLVIGNAVMKWDAMDLYLPWKFFIVDGLQNGHLPLWNPYINSGFAQMGDPGSWYPISWIIGFPAGYSMWSLHIEYLLHLYLGGLGFYFCAKKFSVSSPAALTMGAVYMLSGLMIGNAQHIGWIVSAAWFPWVVNQLLRVNRNDEWKHVLGLSLVLFLMFSGGYPGYFLSTLYVMLVITIVQFSRKYQKGKYGVIKGALLKLGVSAIIFLALSAVVIVSSLDLSEQITRGAGLSQDGSQWDVLSGSLPPKGLISLVAPATTLKNDFSFWGGDFSMINTFFGFISLILIAFGFSMKESRRWVFILSIVAVLFFIVAMGTTFPLRSWLTHLPFLNLFRFPTLFRLYAIFFVLLSAAKSLDMLLKRDGAKSWFFLFWLINVALFALITVIGVFGFPNWRYKVIFQEGWIEFVKIAERTDLFFLQIAVLFAITAGAAIVIWRKREWFNKAIITAIILEISCAALMNNYGTVMEDRSISESHKGIINAVQGYPIPSLTEATGTYTDVYHAPSFNYLWKNLSMYRKTPTSGGISPYTLNTTQQAINEGVYEDAIKRPILYTTNRIDQHYMVDTLSLNTSGDRIKITSFDPNQITVHIDADTSCILVYNQNYYPSWRVRVDGTMQTTYNVDQTFLGARIAPGKHEVQFRFEPNRVIRASWISFTAWIIVFIVGLWMNIKPKLRGINS